MLETVQVWVMKNLLSWSSVQQLSIIMLALTLSWVVARRADHWFKPYIEKWRSSSLILFFARIHLSTHELINIFTTPFLLLVASMIADAAKWPFNILSASATLAIAWAIIRLSSSIIKSDFWSRTIALTMWIVAALNILGWLDPTLEVLDKASIPIGHHKLSLLLLLKGGVILAILLWLAGVATEGLERLLWRSKGLSPSQKVLFTKFAKISFIILAVVLGLNAVGIDFTALAVFSGAVGIGIGFGLQKVFANLISGFILLMDKSIKPGDVIAIADTYGWVNQIGARHVSILTRDGKEHLIPNEKLITEPVENWSYSNENVRIHIPIGVSYHSDRKLVKDLLLEIVRSNPRILREPEPSCLIKGFSDNAVDFELRVWITDPVNGISNVRSSVYEAVWDTFKEHKIEIPFPQRDINLKLTQLQNLNTLLNKESLMKGHD